MTLSYNDSLGVHIETLTLTLRQGYDTFLQWFSWCSHWNLYAYFETRVWHFLTMILSVFTLKRLRLLWDKGMTLSYNDSLSVHIETFTLTLRQGYDTFLQWFSQCSHWNLYAYFETRVWHFLTMILSVFTLKPLRLHWDKGMTLSYNDSLGVHIETFTLTLRQGYDTFLQWFSQCSHWNLYAYFETRVWYFLTIILLVSTLKPSIFFRKATTNLIIIIRVFTY